MNDIKKLEHNQNLYLFGRQTYNQNPGLENIITPAYGIPKGGKTADSLACKGFPLNIFMVPNRRAIPGLGNHNENAKVKIH